MTAFLKSFGLAFALAALVFTAAGFGVGAFLFREPPLRYEAGGFSFIVPDGWSCRREETETVCDPSGPPLRKRAIIVATAKVVGPNDTERTYQTYLNATHSPQSRHGTAAAPSKILSVRKTEIGGETWLDAVQEGSLLPNYRSRYLVISRNATAVLLTFSFRKEIFDEHLPLMDALAASMRLREWH